MAFALLVLAAEGLNTDQGKRKVGRPLPHAEGIRITC
jgi:hypothetical protein